MKKIKTTLLLLTVAIIFNNACKKSPATTTCNLQGNYTYTLDTATRTYQFTNTYTPISSTDSIRWVFGDGATSTLRNPVHTYAAAGAYPVCLRVIQRNASGALTNCLQESCNNITVPLVYTKVNITKMTILNFPPDNIGSNWDGPTGGGTDPDVYFKVNIASLGEVYTSTASVRRENLTLADLPVEWSSFSVLVPNLTQATSIQLYDYDYLTNPELMGSATFTFSNYTTGPNKYPSTVTATNGLVSIKLDLQWVE